MPRDEFGRPTASHGLCDDCLARALEGELERRSVAAAAAAQLRSIARLVRARFVGMWGLSASFRDDTFNG